MLPSWLTAKSRLPKWMDASRVYSLRGPPLALAVVPRFLGRGGRAFGALIASPSPLKGKSRLPKWIVILGSRLASWLAIRSLENFVVECTSPLPGALTVDVSNIAPTSKFSVHVSCSGGCAVGARFILVWVECPYFQSSVACATGTIDDQNS
jgi:hypothetical protein